MFFKKTLEMKKNTFNFLIPKIWQKFDSFCKTISSIMKIFFLKSGLWIKEKISKIYSLIRPDPLTHIIFAIFSILIHNDLFIYLSPQRSFILVIVNCVAKCNWILRLSLEGEIFTQQNSVYVCSSTSLEMSKNSSIVNGWGFMCL